MNIFYKKAEQHRQEQQLLADKKRKGDKGHKATWRILNNASAPPLYQAKRTKVGPKGQPVGSISTNPMEVDSIVTEILQKVCDGNATDHDKLVNDFAAKYDKEIFTREEFQIDDIDYLDFYHYCLGGQDSAGGLDMWTPADMKVLSPECYRLLTYMLNGIEKGKAWPSSLTTAKAAFLAKDVDKSCDPLAHRILLILSTLYRKWAGYRQRSLKPWILEWATKHMFAGIPDMCALDAWYDSALDIEEAICFERHLTGGAADIYKCFDQVIPELAHYMLMRAGMPERILGA
jgi:hypothetical protein